MLWGPTKLAEFQKLVVPGYANIAMGFNEYVFYPCFLSTPLPHFFQKTRYRFPIQHVLRLRRSVLERPHEPTQVSGLHSHFPCYCNRYRLDGSLVWSLQRWLPSRYFSPLYNTILTPSPSLIKSLCIGTVPSSPTSRLPSKTCTHCSKISLFGSQSLLARFVPYPPCP